jgi:FO synthase
MTQTDDRAILSAAKAGRRLTRAQALALAECADLDALIEAAGDLRDRGHGAVQSYSRKVFIPLTQLCRDVCHYCTFAQPPRRGARAYLTPGEVLAVARRGQAAGCQEALFTLGDKPELRYRMAREELAALGHDTTLSYLEAMARLVLDETGLLPHLNPGVMEAKDIARLRKVSVSQGLMLESASARLCEKGGPHYGSPDKDPARRLETIRLAGEARVPFTSGILIGIGETRAERIESLLALRGLHECHGHIQEIIVQNFRAKPGTRMADWPDPPLAEHLWTIAVARLIFGPEMTIQAPPNLSPGALRNLIRAGINDWGGVSPVTPDHVNPEAPWPQLAALARETEAAGKTLAQRLAVYPRFAMEPGRWLDPALRGPVLRAGDSNGFAREDDWSPGSGRPLPDRDLAWLAAPAAIKGTSSLTSLLNQARDGQALGEQEIADLFSARGRDFADVCAAADGLRRDIAGDAVTYVVNRNINYTNVCTYRCRFCAFSKGKASENLRGRAYDLDLAEIGRRTREAWDRGATEVCMQGGIHPRYTGETYLGILRAVKAAAPGMHVHAFSPLEVWQGARTLGLTIPDYLTELRAAGLGSLPGTAAEILDDEVRAVICPDKITTGEWRAVMENAHGLGLKTTATIMFGHVDRPVHWARHLALLREVQDTTRGFTEFVPLPFVHMEAPLYLKGAARPGPSFRESLLMHAVARLALGPGFRNIQVSWVKMGPDGAAAALGAGANDLGGTLMNETITRAAGAVHGQEMPPERLESLIRALGREPAQRTTLYGDPPAERRAASFAAAPLAAPVNAPPRPRVRDEPPRELVRPA